MKQWQRKAIIHKDRVAIIQWGNSYAVTAYVYGTVPIIERAFESDSWHIPVLNMEGEKIADIFADYICPNSIRAKNAIFKGGLVGTSREARGSTQKYQHGLRGLEKEFAEVVIAFIFADSNT